MVLTPTQPERHTQIHSQLYNIYCHHGNRHRCNIRDRNVSCFQVVDIRQAYWLQSTNMKSQNVSQKSEEWCEESIWRPISYFYDKLPQTMSLHGDLSANRQHTENLPNIGDHGKGSRIHIVHTGLRRRCVWYRTGSVSYCKLHNGIGNDPHGRHGQWCCQYRCLQTNNVIMEWQLM